MKKIKYTSGYPSYPKSEDIYEQEDKIAINAEGSLLDKSIRTSDLSKELDSKEMGDELDVPGSEFDDADEVIGNEDEENNYYSLGGDNHNNLDETIDDTL